jgi:glycosyltransferase involved in cell wall biosynthesis
MRVGLLIYDSLDAVSGGYLYDRMLVDYLRRQGVEVEIIAIPRRSYAFQLADNLSPALNRRLTQANLDLILQDELNHPSLFWLNQRRKRSKTDSGGLQMVSIVHHLRASEDHPGWQMKLYREVESRYLRSVDGFIFNSQTTRRSVEAFAGNQVPSLVAYPAGDRFLSDTPSEEIVSRAHQGGPLRLLFVGNIIPRKGLHTLLKAVQLLSEETATLTVVGAPGANRGYNTAIVKQIAESNLQSQVRFVGHLDYEKLADQYRSHHILVVPSSYEGFGIVYLEGMSFGLPAVGSTDGGAGEVISHGENGYLVSPGNQEQLSRLLSDLHQDRSKLAQMSLAARQRFREHPTWDETCAAIHNFLKHMASRPSSMDT